MVCPSCGAEFEGRFCPSCGTDTQPFAYLCVRCGAPFSGPTCPHCGTPVAGVTPPGKGVREAGSVVWTFAVILFLLLLAVNLATLLYGSVFVVQGVLADGAPLLPLYVLVPYPIGDAVEIGVPLFLAYFLAIVAVIVAAYAWHAVRDARSTAKAFTRPLAELRARLESRSAWVATGQVFIAAFSFQMVFILLLSASGSEPSSPAFGGPQWYFYFAFANASVYEEIVTRWMLIGLPLFVAAYVLRGRDARRPPRAATRVPPWRHLFGGTIDRHSPRPLVLAAAVLLFASSVLFGLAHVPAWGWWKFLPSFVAGLGMGYLFLRHGLFAAVLFHFATNYIPVASSVGGGSFAVQLAFALLVLAIIVLGLVFLVWYLVYGIELVNHFLIAWGHRRPAPAATQAPAPFVQAWSERVPPSGSFRTTSAAPAPPYGVGLVPFTCPHCGWQEARYADGRFTCLRCGQASP